MEPLETYRGREQTFIKHDLLKAYLERLFMIVGRHQRTICYVDCFAGPWESNSADLKDTSIAISLDIIRKCREGLLKNGKDVRFRALFIEESKRAFGKLINYLESRKDDGIETAAMHGEFHTLVHEILDWCGNDSFAFFFVDPTGWKNAIEPSTLTPLLKRPDSEFLINFMYDFLSRTVPNPDFQKDMELIFGEVPVTDGMSPEARESLLVNLYRSNLKKVTPSGGGQPRAAYAKIQRTTKDRTHYHLVYLTRHPKGIVVFMEASEKSKLVESKVRARTKQEHRIEKSRQQEFVLVGMQNPAEQAGTDLTEVKNFWLKCLSTEPKLFGISEFAAMLEETGWFPSELQKAFGELAAEDMVRNLDAKGPRRVNAVNFDKRPGERLMKVQP